jgi:hypothetical protein
MTKNQLVESIDPSSSNIANGENNMTGLEQIVNILGKIQEDFSLYKARSKLRKIERLKDSLMEFTDMEISNMFNISLHKRQDSIHILDRLITQQEKSIKWLLLPKTQLKTTPAQDRSIDQMYEAQRDDAEVLGQLPFVND